MNDTSHEMPGRTMGRVDGGCSKYVWSLLAFEPRRSRFSVNRITELLPVMPSSFFNISTRFLFLLEPLPISYSCKI